MARRHLALALLLTTAACTEGATDVADSAAARVDTAAAPLPTYAGFRLQARSSEDPFDPSGTYRVPAGSILKNISPTLNSRGEVALPLMAGGHHQVWKNGAVIHEVPDNKGYVSRASIDDAGDVVFDVMEASTGNGVWVHRQATGQTSFFAAEPLGADGWTNASLGPSGRVRCRVGAGGNHYIGLVSEEGFIRLAAETATHPSSPYQFLFVPSFDSADRAAAKVWLATGGNEIRLFAQGTPARTLVQDREANPASPYAKLDNGVALNDGGQVAFIATIAGHRTVLRVNADGSVATLAAEGQGDVAKIAWFTPAMNATGVVVFKGEDRQGRNTIWVANDAAVRAVVTAGDPLPVDQGAAVALPETEVDPTNRVAFGGGVAINARGDVAFVAALARSTNTHERLGTAVYVATAK